MKSLYKHLLYPAFETVYKGRKTLKYLNRLEETQWMNLNRLLEIQELSLRALLTHAYENIPYYRLIWKQRGWTSVNLLLKNFYKMPLLTKEIINKKKSIMMCKQLADKLIPKSTGGSTGLPLHFYIDQESYERRNAISLRGYKWAGADIGTKQFYLWGGGIEKPTISTAIKDKIYNSIHRRTILNCFALKKETLEDNLKKYNNSKAEILVAYTNALYHFAKDIEDCGLIPVAPKSIIVGAEKLHDFQRTRIESVFKSRVYETYGSREFMLIGSECKKHEGLHISMEHLIVEILNDDGSPTKKGEVGNVVVTDLFNFGMPFVRYVTGDRAVAGFKKCSCGRELPLLSEVKGRRLDALTFANGRTLPGEFFPHLFKDYPEVSRFQVTQKNPLTLQINVVVDRYLSQKMEKKIKTIIQDHVGRDIIVLWNQVNSIPLTVTGKHRVVVNQCA